MAERPLERAFWRVASNYAADDPQLQEAVGRVLIPRMRQSPENFEPDEPDYDELSEYLHRKYGMAARAVIDETFDLCELRVLEGHEGSIQHAEA